MGKDQQQQEEIGINRDYSWGGNKGQERIRGKSLSLSLDRVVWLKADLTLAVSTIKQNCLCLNGDKPVVSKLDISYYNASLPVIYTFQRDLLHIIVHSFIR